MRRADRTDRQTDTAPFTYSYYAGSANKLMVTVRLGCYRRCAQLHYVGRQRVRPLVCVRSAAVCRAVCQRGRRGALVDQLLAARWLHAATTRRRR